MKIMVIGWLLVISLMVAGFATSTDYALRGTVRVVRVIVTEAEAK